MISSLQSKLLTQRALFQRLQSSKKRSKLQAGFTLIELLIVVIILGVLTAIALPAFLNQQDKAKVAAANTNSISAARGCAAAQVTGDHVAYTATIDTAAVTGTCAASGTASTFTSVAPPMTTPATAIVAADGNTRLTIPAVK
ncbi:MAG: type II secretion system GspH family protein [Cyanobium usitatum Tobar12.5m-G36]|nr:type II secretion system GspH family protein [Cyanobium usitatum Tobar12.5m-G36]